MPRHRTSNMDLRGSAQPPLSNPTRPIPIARGRSMTRYKSGDGHRCPDRSVRPPARASQSESPPLILGELDGISRPSTPAAQTPIISAASPHLYLANIHARRPAAPSIECRFCRQWCYKESLEAHRRSCPVYQRQRRQSNSDALLRFVKTASSVRPPPIPTPTRPQPPPPPPPPSPFRRNRKTKP
ncbi:hypothetical protein BD626DRAFT_119924 [Schizophyllum amplum]|uniref:Uncharacterized protein n=1 Tax=Schizophyllum amplum TaxID=97359 RepID=A0A550CV81_9AGAR|nr:hypothetical protein BD626DRAFT_119924 [Auriculariopsis ampla]